MNCETALCTVRVHKRLFRIINAGTWLMDGVGSVLGGGEGADVGGGHMCVREHTGHPNDFPWRITYSPSLEGNEELLTTHVNKSVSLPLTLFMSSNDVYFYYKECPQVGSKTHHLCEEQRV